MRSQCRRCDAGGVMNLLLAAFSRLFVQNLALSTIGGQMSGVENMT